MQFSNSFENIVIFLFSTVIILHIMACLWVFFISFASESTEGSFIDADYKAMKTSDKYIHSLYFMITTLSTVGYGDLSASNPLEKIVCIIAMILGVASFAYVTSTMTDLVQSYGQDTLKLDNNLKLLTQMK